jgi:hypothetical protein
MSDLSLATKCTKDCSCVICQSPTFHPTVSSRISQELVSFYAQLGWDEKTRQEFLSSSLGYLSQAELITLLEQEIGDFLDKCHPLLLALVNSIRQGGLNVN